MGAIGTRLSLRPLIFEGGLRNSSGAIYAARMLWRDLGVVWGLLVMAGLVPAIHVFRCLSQDVDARHKAGHDELG